MAESKPQTLVLASASPRRIQLLQQAGIETDRVLPTDIDETPQRAEHPRSLAKRLSKEKAEKALGELKSEPDARPAFVLAADTVVAVGRRVLPKAESPDEVAACLRLMSGRAHKVLTGVAVRAPGGREAVRLVETRLHFKRLTEAEIADYVASGEGQGKAGGYGIQGRAGAFIISLEGSYPSVVGLPLYETLNLLTGLGYRP